MRKRSFDYFASFIKMMDYSRQCALSLESILLSYDVDKMKTQLSTLHEIEHCADGERHELIEHLAHEFMTPIEREDIIELAQQIDDVTDGIEDILIKLYMYNITEIRGEIIDLVKLIKQSCEALVGVLSELKSFKQMPPTMKKGIIEVNRLEEVGDVMYIDNVRKLFSETIPSDLKYAWTEIYHCLEKCCDDCEHVANTVEIIIMKNS